MHSLIAASSLGLGSKSEPGFFLDKWHTCRAGGSNRRCTKLNGWIEHELYLAFEHRGNATESQALLHVAPLVRPVLPAAFVSQFASLAFG